MGRTASGGVSIGTTSTTAAAGDHDHLTGSQVPRGGLDGLDAKYQVDGGVAVHDGTRFLQGVADEMTGAVDADLWTEDIPDPTTMTIVGGASGTTFDATAAAPTGHQRSTWTIPASLCDTPFAIRWHSNMTNYANETSAGVEIDDGTNNITIMHRYFGSTFTVAPYRDGNFGSSASVGAAVWICALYNPVTGKLVTYKNSTAGSTDDPGWPAGNTDWTTSDSSTVSSRPAGTVKIQRFLYQDHASQATMIMRCHSSGFLRLR